MCHVSAGTELLILSLLLLFIPFVLWRDAIMDETRIRIVSLERCQHPLLTGQVSNLFAELEIDRTEDIHDLRQWKVAFGDCLDNPSKEI